MNFCFFGISTFIHLPDSFQDYSKLSASELLVKRKELLDEAKQTIASNAHQLLGNPQENVGFLYFVDKIGFFFSRLACGCSVCFSF